MKKCVKCGKPDIFYWDYKQVGTNGLTIMVEKCTKCDGEQPRDLTPIERALLH